MTPMELVLLYKLYCWKSKQIMEYYFILKKK